MKPTLLPQEAADLLGRSRRTIYRWHRLGLLQSVPGRGPGLRFSAASVRALLPFVHLSGPQILRIQQGAGVRAPNP
jgi:hypothetical protein